MEYRQFYLKNITGQNEMPGRIDREKQAATDPEGKEGQIIYRSKPPPEGEQRLIKAHEE